METNDLNYIISISPENHVIHGGDQICGIIKRRQSDIPRLVREGRLKAWQVGQKGKWRAICTDLLAFNIAERDQKIK